MSNLYKGFDISSGPKQQCKNLVFRNRKCRNADKLLKNGKWVCYKCAMYVRVLISSRTLI